MCRSILPATNRRSARADAAGIKRQNRRYTRSTLREWAKECDPYEFEGFANNDTNRSTHGWDGTIVGVMWTRRDHDKTGPLSRWAERLIATKLKDMTGEEHREYFKAILPDNTIGRHALSHLNHLLPEENPYLYGYRQSDYYNNGRFETEAERKATAKAYREGLVAEMATRLIEIIATDHGAFNRQVTCLSHFKELVEPLLGQHHVEEWASKYLYNEGVAKIVKEWS